MLLTAPTAGTAPLLTEQRPDDGFSRPLLTNVAAVPSMVVCGGFTAAGLPLGLEIIGPAWGDATVLRVGHHFEQAVGTRTRRPELLQAESERSGRLVRPCRCAPRSRWTVLR